MAKRKPKKAVKDAADRAERRSAGKADTKAPSVLDPPEDTRGRPTEYRPNYCDIAAETCARGGTIAELADRLGVARWTIYRWMAEHQAFGDAIRVAREVADERVGFSLYERAVGYTYDAVKILQNAGVPLVVPYKEHVPPDVGAQKHWLANRQPDKWRDVSRFEHTGKDGEPIEIAGSEHEVARRIAFMLGKAVGRAEGRTENASVGS